MLILKNGRILDPMNEIDRIDDVTVDGQNIMAIGTACPEPGDNVIDAAGCIITPGLIDHHTHLYPLAKIGLPAEAACFAAGVTTAVDAGSTGYANYAERRPFLQYTKLGIRTYLNVCSTGLDNMPEDLNPAHFDVVAIRECLQKYPELVGLKIRTSASIVKELGYGPVKAAVALAEQLGTHVLVHSTDPPGQFSELLDILNPGDILTHMYMNQGSCLVENGKVVEAAYRARERGVLFEAADARLHFGMDVARTAIQEGFYPDILATDLTKLSMHLRPTAFNMAMQVSKYTHLGIPFEKTIALCTAAPAKQLGMADQIGSLTVGHRADIAVFRPISAENIFGDRPQGSKDQRTSIGDTLYKPMLTVKNGEMVYRDMTF